jgi:hypothetical protein
MNTTAVTVPVSIVYISQAQGIHRAGGPGIPELKLAPQDYAILCLLPPSPSLEISRAFKIPALNF